MLIGDRLKEERERLGFNQADFAGLGKSSKRSQIEWEKGNAFPNAQVLAAMAVAGADVQYILTGVRATAYPQTSMTLSPTQMALLDNFACCLEQDRLAIERIMASLAEASRRAKPRAKG